MTTTLILGQPVSWTINFALEINGLFQFKVCKTQNMCFQPGKQQLGEEKSILDKVYKRVIESLEQLNTKKEEYIINELNSFDKDQT